MPSVVPLFYVDNLSLIMMGLVGFVGLSVASFSSRYLEGDRKKGTFYLNLIALIGFILVMVCADHIFLLFAAWTASNLLLTNLMLHKHEWKAARQSSYLALRNFALGLLFLGSSLSLFYFVTGETSIQAIIGRPIENKWLMASTFLMILGTMSQSALWPFHRCLISSLNSPTPVSAIMHAGLVNGGGFILARFAPILSEQPFILNFMFMIGMMSALLGTLWKLMQSDIKRMLACSTMGQMGFMIAQCGLGLFPAAVAHLCWHGLFKAYLFLSSGSAAQEKRLDLDSPPATKHFFMSLICGGFGAYAFALNSGKTIFATDTTLFLILIAMIAGAQFSLPIIRSQSLIRLPLSLIATFFTGAVYGLSVHFIEQTLMPLGIVFPQPLNLLHLIALLALCISWILILFGCQPKRVQYPDWVLKAYVYMLNASQPHPSTVTAHRNQYQF